MQEWLKDVPGAVARAKRELRQKIPDLAERYRAVTDRVEREVAQVVEEARRGEVIPELPFSQVAGGQFPAALAARIRRRGCAIVRGVFPRAQIEAWNGEIGEYIERNHYVEKSRQKVGLDNYFGTLAAASPQIFGLYWSRPQVLARQSEGLATVRAALNRLWRVDRPAGPAFDPARECTYGDRLRRRQPGDTTLGLSAHVDGASVERWCDPSYHRVYHDVFFGAPGTYDSHDGRHRVSTNEISSAAVTSVFRTYQGWTAMSRQGAGDGTLQLIPIASLMEWMLLRPLQDDVPPDDLCGAKPGHALPFDPRWHGAAAPGLVSIPVVEPGDTVWWHCDMVHAVEKEHRGVSSSNVIYIAAVPKCEKNAAFLPGQARAFLEGRSVPDFAPEDYEVDFVGRATLDDLTPLGRRQMGFEPW